MKINTAFLLIPIVCAFAASCEDSSTTSSNTATDAGTDADSSTGGTSAGSSTGGTSSGSSGGGTSSGTSGSGSNGGTSGAGGSGGTTGTIGDAENLYIAAVNKLTSGLDDAACTLMTTLTSDYESYYPLMTNEQYKDYASTRFKPVVDFMSRKLCNQFEITGSVEAYKAAALADSPAGAFLSGTQLLKAIYDRSSEVDSLLATVNAERSTQGLDPVIVAEYPNSIVGGGNSTIVFFPGWPDRPNLDQWIQIQRTVGQMFFVTLEPRSDGTYNSYLHGRNLTTGGSSMTVGTSVENGTCLQCHYSGKPLHMRALADATEAAKVATLVGYLQAYPAKTNHPDYNPFPSSPGIGTGGTLTLEEASTYAGRSLTTSELETINKNTACDACHNNTLQNALRPPLDQTVDILMANGIMPPGSGVVDSSERAEAIKVMKAAYKVKLKNYLLGN
ncbi:MAG: hypothetical protein U0165_10560 [Polyangiaceae bacterium]